MSALLMDRGQRQRGTGPIWPHTASDVPLLGQDVTPSLDPVILSSWIGLEQLLAPPPRSGLMDWP